MANDHERPGAGAPTEKSSPPGGVNGGETAPASAAAAGKKAVHKLNGGRTRNIIIAVIAVLVVLGAGLAVIGKKTAAGSGPLTVTTARAQLGYLNNATIISGKLDAVQTASIVPKIPGRVASVYVDVGSAVQAGQVLVALDNQDLKDRVDQARAGVAQAEAAVAQAQAGVQAAQAGTGAAQAALATARANYEVAKANYQRGQQLLAAGAIPQAVFETQYELPYKQAEQAYENSAPSQVAGTQAQQAQAAAGLKTAQAGLAAAQAALALAQQTYEDSFIRAPFSGVVTGRNINPGEMAATMPVITMVNLDQLVLKGYVGEDVINRLQQGEKVSVSVDAVSGRTFTGVITNISPAADPVTKDYLIKIEIDNSNHLLKPGMFATVQLSRNRKKSLLVPRTAVVKDGDASYVWVLKDGVVERREVKLGDSDGTSTIITAGLSAGDDVVTAGQETLHDGARVSVQKS